MLNVYYYRINELTVLGLSRGVQDSLRPVSVLSSSVVFIKLPFVKDITELFLSKPAIQQATEVNKSSLEANRQKLTMWSTC